MKIDIGTDGKILGTKRVSSNGQISGFSEYAGREVLVVLPGSDTPTVTRDASDLLLEAEQLVRQQMDTAFSKYRQLREKYGTPEQAAKSFLRGANTNGFQGLVAKADAWVRDQLGRERAAPKRKTSKRKV